MDQSNMGGMSQQPDGSGQMNAGSMQQAQQGQNAGGAAANQNNFMSSLMGQLSQMQQGGAPGGLGGGGGGAQQVPLLVGATPLQQQLSALQGLAAGQPGGAPNNMSGGDQQGQQNQGFQQSLFFGGAPQGQNQGFSQQGQQQGQPQQGQPQQQQQGQQPNPQNPFGMMGQNPLLGGNLGFNVQQLQQLQLAQQLMAAGLPPQLAFGGQQLMGGAGTGASLSLGQNPQLASLASNPGAASLGFGAPNAAAVGGALGGQVTAPNVPSSNAGVASATTAEPAAAKAAGSGGGSVGDGQDWAEPFSGKGKKEPPFPLKLHQILSNPEFQECICWNPHGRSWRILKPPVFEQLVIPLYFRHAKYASFMRQVNGWGFKRIVSGNDHNSYYHELFLRDYPQLCLKMKRIRKGDKVSEAIDEKEQNEKSIEGGEANEEDGNSDNQEGGSEDKEESGEEENEEEQNPPVNVVMGNDAEPKAAAAGTGGVGSQTQGATNANLSAVSGMAAQFPNQQQSQQAPAPADGGIGGLDQSALMKLQEALQGGGGASLLQQQQQPGQQQMPFGLNGLNMGNLGNLGGALAAQLQQATQPPQQNSDANGANSGVGGGTLQEMVAQLQQQRQQQQNNNSNTQQSSEGETV